MNTHLELTSQLAATRAVSTIPTMARLRGEPWGGDPSDPFNQADSAANGAAMVAYLRTRPNSMVHFGYVDSLVNDLKLHDDTGDASLRNIPLSRVVDGVVSGMWRIDQAVSRGMPAAKLLIAAGFDDLPWYFDFERVPNADPTSETSFPGGWPALKARTGVMNNEMLGQRVGVTTYATCRAIMAALGMNPDNAIVEGISRGTTVYGAMPIPGVFRSHVDATNPHVASPSSISTCFESIAANGGDNTKSAMWISSQNSGAFNASILDVAKKYNCGDVVVFPEGTPQTTVSNLISTQAVVARYATAPAGISA